MRKDKREYCNTEGPQFAEFRISGGSHPWNPIIRDAMSSLGSAGVSSSPLLATAPLDLLIS